MRPFLDRAASNARSRWVVVVVAFVVSSVVASAGWGWSTYYVKRQWYPPGSFNHSAWNGSISYNAIHWADANGDIMQLTLCNTSDACYEYDWSYYDFADPRSIAYGRAKCQARSANPPVPPQGNQHTNFVYWCFTSNDGARPDWNYDGS